jgi:tetratricopeptide (TPR) repeat protein
VFAIQSEVAQSIARKLQAVLSPEVINRIEKKSTTNLEAYGFYLRGRDYYYRYTREDNERALGMFHRALQADPQYALAYAGIGDAYSMRATRYRLGWKWVDSVMMVSMHAIALDPALAEGHKELGMAYDLKGQTGEALEEYDKALKLNPNYALVLGNIGAIEYTLGHYDRALSWVKKAVHLHASSSFPIFCVSVTLIYRYRGWVNFHRDYGSDFNGNLNIN